MEEQGTNELIPKLIEKINVYSDKLKDRVKIDSIFSEFYTYAHSDFQKFIKMSDKRYKGVKSGNCLNNILKNQKKEYRELSNQILKNNFYITNDIEKESQKLFKKVPHKENKELYKIRRSIIEKTKNFTQKEIKNREKFASAGQRENRQIEKGKKDNKLSHLDLIYKPKFRASKSNISTNNILSPLEKNSDENEEKDEYEEKKIFYDNMMVKDKQDLNKNITEYKKYLENIKNSFNENENDINKIINSGNTFGHKYSFKLDNIKLLTYKEEKKEDVKVKKKENQNIDIIKLMRYTKRGNKKWFQEELKRNSQKRIKSFQFKKNKALKNKNKSLSASSPCIHKPNYNSENSIIQENNSFGATSSTAFSNFQNTIKTVKNEAELIRHIGQNFDKKRNTMEGFFKRDKLPKIEEYENLMKTRNHFLKNQMFSDSLDNNYQNIINSNIPKNYGNTNNQDFLYNKDLFEQFKRTYMTKKIEWAKEDDKKNKIRKKQKQLIEETKKYLKEVKLVRRKTQLYVDPYSRRDGVINKRIKLFTRSLSGPFYSKKKLQNRIDEFNHFVEAKEKEKIINDEVLRKKLLEEAKKNQEEADEFQIIEKMRRNLSMEKNNDDEDINFNYQYISTSKIPHNEVEGQPYDEYLEFFDLAKNRQKNGYYDFEIKETKKDNFIRNKKKPTKSSRFCEKAKEEN